MGKVRSGVIGWVIIIFSFGGLAACGGGKKGTALFPSKITLNPSTNTSLVVGGTLIFTATAVAGTSTTLNVPITYSSSDTSVVSMNPAGVACAGHWDITFTICTAGGTGVAQVTASALGASSIPTYVFVHAPIDNISVTGVLLTGVPVQEPCLPQTQSMTLEAHAFSQGNDITASVGPFTWSANNINVVTLTPLVNSAYNFPTNQVTATAANPGITYIYATASGVASTSFQQPQYSVTAGGPNSPLLDFFATCPIQSISLDVGTAGSGQTTFAVSKGTSETAVATMSDVMGNSSLPNTNGQVVLSKIPLTWISSQPAVVGVGSGCMNTCALTTSSPGAATITASCSPPTCNIGFPTVPNSLSTPAQIAACTSFFQGLYPQFAGCQALIPAPVYAAPPTGAISALIDGNTSTPSVLAASTGCIAQPPSTCGTSMYSVAKGTAGTESPLPDAPNSLLFDLAGDKAYMGSQFGALSINPANFGTNNSPFSLFGNVTGKILAASNNGVVPLFSDTIHTPNQVFVITPTATTALNIPAAVAAAFSPDSLKAFVLGNSGSSLYVYSPLQALQGPIALSGAANAVAFSPSGAFAYVAEAAAGAAPANITAFATCNNQPVATTVPLPGNPVLTRVLPNVHIDGRDSYGYTIPDGIHVLVLDTTGFDIITSTIAPPVTATLCPQVLNFTSNDPARAAQRVELDEGTLQPLNFFASADGSQLYVVSSDNSTILIYNFISGSVTGGIELLGNAIPLSADMAVDAGTIVVAGSDGLLHEVSTALGGGDLVQVSFPNLPDYLNPFCTYAPNTGPCALTTVAARP